MTDEQTPNQTPDEQEADDFDGDLDVVVPDSPEGLVTPRFYRKQAQYATLHALYESRGRSGLTDEEKVEQVRRMQTYLSEALAATNMALDLMVPAAE